MLYSRGSLLPFFNEIGGDNTKSFFTVTDKRMTRFFMTIDESVELIRKAIDIAESGDTIVSKMHSYSIDKIAQYFSEKYHKPIVYTGLRPGEKLHESLINITESSRTIEMDDMFIIKPCYKNIRGNMVEEEYDSNLINYNINEILN